MSYNRGKNYWKHLKRDFNRTGHGRMYEVNSIEDKLSGWGFEMGALSASESMKEGEGALSSQPPKAPRAFSTNVSNDNLPYNDKASLSPNGNICEYSGLLSVDNYMEE